MTTTALLIEHLISGVQATVWLILLSLTVFGYRWFNIDSLKGTEAYFIPLLLAIAYPLGVFVDNLADDLFKRTERKLTRKVLESEGLKGIRLTMMQVMGNADRDFAREYFAYVRSRVRLSRSTALNFLLITFIGISFTSLRLNIALDGWLWFVVTGEALLGTIVVLLALRSWFSSSQTFTKQMVRAHKVNQESDKVPQFAGIVVADD